MGESRNIINQTKKMKVLLTGFTDKSFNGYSKATSRNIMDLTTVMPMILKDINVEFEYAKASVRAYAYDKIFVKLWDLTDKINVHEQALNLAKELNAMEDLSKVIFIQDHHDSYPAYYSMEKIGLTNLCKHFINSRFIVNKFVSKTNSNFETAFDISSYIPALPTIELPVQGLPRWVYASLSEPLNLTNVTNLGATLPFRTFTELPERELEKAIGKYGLVWLDEHSHADPLWWRIRYLMAARNGAAVYASERDQLAIYGFYVSPTFIENNRKEVAALQSSVFLQNIESKESIQKKMKKLLL